MTQKNPANSWMASETCFSPPDKPGGSTLFQDPDGYFWSPPAAAAHAIMVQGGFTTARREAARMIRAGGRSAETAREWLAWQELDEEQLLAEERP